MGKKVVVALAGNPNSGKTTIFNQLTGARQHVGNYPGVTVEVRDGQREHGGLSMKIVDLPGTYSLTAYSAEEVVARNFIIEEKPDVVVDIIDASNLERNLYLAVELMELKAPLVLAFNMSDEAKSRGYEFDTEKLSRFFGAPVVQTIGHKGIGISELLDAIASVAQNRKEGGSSPSVSYGKEIEEEIAAIIALLKKTLPPPSETDLRWLALKLLENDKEARGRFKSPELNGQIAKSASRIEKLIGDSPETAIAARRYGFISGACQESVRSTIEIRHTISDRIDAVVTNRVMAMPIFLGLMYLVFKVTFSLGRVPMAWIEKFFGWLGGAIEGLWPPDSTSLVKDLLVQGVIGGVGGVLTFLPVILVLFLAIAFLEDSGYMARAAFIMDRVMHKIGLHGKSFIPLLIGFGCTVPAIMATRTLENRRDRLTTMLVAPLMSCGARLPIYALIIPAFFQERYQAAMLWTIYMIGILLAIVTAKLLRRTILKGESVPFVMELPPYRMPTFTGLAMHTWERGWLFMRKAGTIILGISILLWALTTFPRLSPNDAALFESERQAARGSNLSPDALDEKLAQIDGEEAEKALQYSAAGRCGRVIEPLLKPMGFDWKIGTALIGAIAAKEVFVAQMGVLYSVSNAEERSDTLREKLRSLYTPLTGFCIMLFCLVSAPCMATFAVTTRESGSLKWGLLQFGGLTLLAYILTIIAFQTGRLLGL
jgi:ferrous iron transport protein B